MKRLHKWKNSIIEGEPAGLLGIIIAVAATGTAGSVAGRWIEIVPSASFGTVGEWVGGIATAASLYYFGRASQRDQIKSTALRLEEQLTAILKDRSNLETRLARLGEIRHRIDGVQFTALRGILSALVENPWAEWEKIKTSRHAVMAPIQGELERLANRETQAIIENPISRLTDRSVDQLSSINRRIETARPLLEWLTEFREARHGGPQATPAAMLAFESVIDRFYGLGLDEETVAGLQGALNKYCDALEQVKQKRGFPELNTELGQIQAAVIKEVAVRVASGAQSTS